MAQAIDYLRKQQLKERLFAPEEEIADVPDLVEAPAEDILNEQLLLKFIAELPNGCRTVFNLYVMEHKSHKEIAEMLEIKEHSSISQLHYAKYLLAKKINEYRNDEKRKR